MRIRAIFTAAAALSAGAFFLGGAAPALADGTVRVTQNDGTLQVYPNVSIRVVDKTLRVTSADGKGTLIVERAACSYTGELLRWLPYLVVWDLRRRAKADSRSQRNDLSQ